MLILVQIFKVLLMTGLATCLGSIVAYCGRCAVEQNCSWEVKEHPGNPIESMLQMT